MFKKYRLIVALLVVGLLSGGFLHTVDASASVGNDNSEWNSNSSEKQYNNDWQGFFKKYFSKWNIQWDFENKSNQDRKSTRLNSSHVAISYAVFCLIKKRNKKDEAIER